MCSNSAQRQFIVNQLERGVRLDVHLGIAATSTWRSPLQCCVACYIHGQVNRVVYMPSWSLDSMPPSRRQAGGVLDHGHPPKKAWSAVSQSIRSMMDIPGLYNGAMHREGSNLLQNTLRAYLLSCSLGQSLWTAFLVARCSRAFSHAKGLLPLQFML